MASIETVDIPLEGLRLFHKNPRVGDVEAIKRSLNVNGQYRAIVVNRGTHTGRPMEVLAGNHTLKAVRDLGWETITAHLLDVDEDQASRIVIADNRTAELGEIDTDVLLDIAGDLDDLEGTGYSLDDLEALSLAAEDTVASVPLADQFGAPPLTVLDARQGAWTDRQRQWRGTIGDSREGRAEGAETFDSYATQYQNWGAIRVKALARNPGEPEQVTFDKYESLLTPFKGGSGISEFDPVLAELLVSWFSATGSRILDPWAGGNVRGAVAGMLGRSYLGIDLSENQVLVNRASIAELGLESRVEYIVGDSLETIRGLPADEFGFAMGCPPYYGLERYSDDPADLSTMRADDFDRMIADTLVAVDRVLQDDSFAAFVVGSVRNDGGNLRDMRALFVDAAREVGWGLANDAVLVTPVGTAAVRAGRSFKGGRSLARVHQDIVVFVKGSRSAAAKKCGDVFIPDLEDAGDE